MDPLVVLHEICNEVLYMFHVSNIIVLRVIQKARRS